jgi:phosphate transport system protein
MRYPRMSAAASPTGKVAVALADSAKQVLVSRDPQAAERLRDEDDAMDHLHRQLFTALLDRPWTDGVGAAVDAALPGRFYERFADHAVGDSRHQVFVHDQLAAVGLAVETDVVDLDQLRPFPPVPRLSA